jgi:hypothetical protein
MLQEVMAHPFEKFTLSYEVCVASTYAAQKGSSGNPLESVVHWCRCMSRGGAVVVVSDTGIPEAKSAAADALTNMASTTYMLPLEGSRQGTATLDDHKSINLKVEVQRAGALPALTSMLRLKDERCVQAAANTLYVLAATDENRKGMQDGGVRQALQEVLAKGKLRPPQITDRTRKDCEEAVSRMLG